MESTMPRERSASAHRAAPVLLERTKGLPLTSRGRGHAVSSYRRHISWLQLRTVTSVLDGFDRTIGYASTPVIADDRIPRFEIYGSGNDAGDLLDCVRNRARALLAVHPDDAEVERRL